MHPRLFRAPYGAWLAEAITLCEQMPMVPLAWSVDPRDWALPGVRSIVATIMGNTRPGSIISEHDRGNRSRTAAALRIVLPRLRHQGYHFQAPLPLPPTTAAVHLLKCGCRGQTGLMRVVVTRIDRDGTARRRVVDTAAHSHAGPWEELIARALAVRPPYRPVPGSPVYHVRVDDQPVLVAEHDLSGPLSDLITAVLAIGEPAD